MEVLATVNRHGQFSVECRPWQQTLIETIGQHAMSSPRTQLSYSRGIWLV